MKSIDPSVVTNIADPAVRSAMMRATVELLRTRPDLGFVLVSVVAAFIDGLAKGKPGETRSAYLAYMRTNFPDLCQSIGAEVFYAHIRNAGIHEFAPRPPFALAPDSALGGKYCETRELNGAEWTVVNADRIVNDFLAHLDNVDHRDDSHAA
jgi:hypothetical protein